MDITPDQQKRVAAILGSSTAEHKKYYAVVEMEIAPPSPKAEFDCHHVANYVDGVLSRGLAEFGDRCVDVTIYDEKTPQEVEAIRRLL